jgi:hypothetical protein
MKAYLIVTGTLFGILAIQHLKLAKAEWHHAAEQLGSSLPIAVSGLVAIGFCVWAWMLFLSLLGLG